MPITVQPGKESFDESSKAAGKLKSKEGSDDKPSNDDNGSGRESEEEDRTQKTLCGDERLPGLQVLNNLSAVFVEQLFHVAEKSNCCLRNCKGRLRGFKMVIEDFAGRQVACLKRPCKCCECICCKRCCATLCTCGDRIRVEAPPENEIGRVIQRCGCTLNFNLFEGGELFGYIIGPSCCGVGCCTCCLREKIFKIYSQSDRSSIGSITKEYGGIVKEIFTDADTFRVLFPIDMSLEAKMAIIGAVFLIDFIAFEDNEAAIRKRI